MEGWLTKYGGKRILAVGAHPDDVEIGSGGTLARLAQEGGAEVLLLVASIPNQLETRRAESIAAAELLHAKAHFLTEDRCCRVEDYHTYDLVQRLDKAVRDFRPAAVFTHSAEEAHWDHVLLHRAILSTLRLSPLDVFLFNNTAYRHAEQAWHPRVWVDISKTIEQKMASLSAHHSQFAGRDHSAEVFREQARVRGGTLKVPYAEAFDVLRLNVW